jgi:hypothetical protein
MIDVILNFGSDIVMVRIFGHSVTFGSANNGNPMMADISGLKLNKAGVVKEFPDLKDNPNWRVEAIARFKDKIKSLDDEDSIYKYIITELSRFGYKPMKKLRQGFRQEVIHGN